MCVCGREREGEGRETEKQRVRRNEEGEGSRWEKKERKKNRKEGIEREQTSPQRAGIYPDQAFCVKAFNAA